MTRSEPLVSVVTPMLNEQSHLAECVESILAQTYDKWELVIVDNCSVDKSLAIAKSYAAKDKRIRVVECQQRIPALPNHNRALQQISSASRYCKVVFADDLIVPECLAKMVDVAEQYPSVGIVGAYGLEGDRVVWTGIPYPVRIVAGRELCRRLFLDGLYVFGTATSLLYRTEVVRQTRPFFIEDHVHGDSEACVVALKTWDFGFVHQVLTISQLRRGSLRTQSEDIGTYCAGKLRELVAHGSAFLTPEEYKRCLKKSVAQYYGNLGGGLLRMRGADYWKYHIDQLGASGVSFSKCRLGAVVLAKLCAGVLNPGVAISKAYRIGKEMLVRKLSTATANS